MKSASNLYLHLTRLMQPLTPWLKELALGYAWIVLLPSWPGGLALAALTFWQPHLGAFGLMGALCGWAGAQMAGGAAVERPVGVFNGLLCGLFAAQGWVAGPGVLALALTGGLLAGWLGVVLGRITWAAWQLPVLSLPFALVCLLTTAASGSLAALQGRAFVAPPEVFGGAVDGFLNAFGALYFSPNPWTGLLIVLLLGLLSRYDLLLALLGYLAARTGLALLGAAPEHLALTGWDSNAMLAALLTGGLLARPSWVTLAYALAAAVLAAWLSLAIGRLLQSAHLSLFSAPFVLACWALLYAGVRHPRWAGHFNLLLPDLPEHTWSRAQSSRERSGAPGSVPLSLPFAGAWTVSQGFDGEHTHCGAWRHALDFIVLQNGRSFAGQGQQLDDFYAYGKPVLSPAYGQVWRVINDVPDNAPGAVNLDANWGNCVVIRLAGGAFVLLAHLKPGSVSALPGAWVSPGDYLGQCGNSGRSPQPHIHLHLQSGEAPGSATLAFHLAGVLVTPPAAASASVPPARLKQAVLPELSALVEPVQDLPSAGGQRLAGFKLAVVPPVGSTVCNTLGGEVCPLFLLPGRGLRYQVSRNGQPAADWRIHCGIDAQSRLVLRTDSGASCVVESNWAVFSCSQRNAVPDPCFDLWLLACGFTPVAAPVTLWRDAAQSARLLPSTTARWLAMLAWPWATLLHSRFSRTWDGEAQAWRQSAQHRQPGSGITLQTQALITPQVGCTALSAQLSRQHVSLQATHAFGQADLGVPAWQAPLTLVSGLM